MKNAPHCDSHIDKTSNGHDYPLRDPITRSETTELIGVHHTIEKSIA